MTRTDKVLARFLTSFSEFLLATGLPFFLLGILFGLALARTASAFAFLELRLSESSRVRMNDEHSREQFYRFQGGIRSTFCKKNRLQKKNNIE